METILNIVGTVFVGAVGAVAIAAILAISARIMGHIIRSTIESFR